VGSLLYAYSHLVAIDQGDMNRMLKRRSVFNDCVQPDQSR
jgi:hypothetical protein